MPIVETHGRVHSFAADDKVLDNVELLVDENSIYGFLGPNGAGKTTTLRIILCLLKRQKGSITIFDKDLDGHRTEVLGKIGSMIERPSIYAPLPARENLQVLQKI